MRGIVCERERDVHAALEREWIVRMHIFPFNNKFHENFPSKPFVLPVIQIYYTSEIFDAAVKHVRFDFHSQFSFCTQFWTMMQIFYTAKYEK